MPQHLGLRERRTHAAAIKLSFNPQPRFGKRIDGEYIAMDKRIVPGRARAIVAMVVASHLLVAREPSRIIVDAVASAANDVGRRLAVGRDAIGVGARGDLVRFRGNVDQYPMEEVDPGQIGGNNPPFLVDVVGPTGHVGIMADNDEGLRTRRDVAPSEMRIAVLRESNMVGRVNDGKGVLARNTLSFLEVVTR